MDCLADTVTIIRHFSGLGRIGKEARLIISTARYLGVPLITSDRAIRKARLVKTIWS